MVKIRWPSATVAREWHAEAISTARGRHASGAGAGGLCACAVLGARHWLLWRFREELPCIFGELSERPSGGRRGGADVLAGRRLAFGAAPRGLSHLAWMGSGALHAERQVDGCPARRCSRRPRAPAPPTRTSGRGSAAPRARASATRTTTRTEPCRWDGRADGRVVGGAGGPSGGGTD